MIEGENLDPTKQEGEIKFTTTFKITRILNISDGHLKGYELLLQGADGSINIKEFFENETEFPEGFNFDTAKGYIVVKTTNETAGLFGGNGNAIQLESWKFIKK